MNVPTTGAGHVLENRNAFRYGIAVWMMVLAASAALADTPGAPEPKIELPRVILRGIPFSISAEGLAAGSVLLVDVGGVADTVRIEAWSTTIKRTVSASGQVPVRISIGGVTLADTRLPSIPGWLSILPAVLAIVAALAFRQVVVALFAGLWLGGWLAYGLSLVGLWRGLLDTLGVYVLQTLADSDHMAIIIFSLMIGGMVGVISRNGGTLGIVNLISGWARSARRGQLASALLGTVIFFDDYANTLIVGNTMRPITDRLRISREKLAYIVDSTAAPVATIALVTTWIGFQVGLIDESVRQIEGYDEAAYSVFLNSIPYAFYTILALVFVYLIAASGRDFGPMLKAEVRARRQGQLHRPDARIGVASSERDDMQPHEGKPQRAFNALLPVLVLVIGTLTGIYVTGVAASGGHGASLREIIGNGNSFTSMMWASLLAVVVAAALSLVQRILTIGEVVDAWYAGLKAMFLAIIILTLAWALSEVNQTLHTAEFLISSLGEAVSPVLLPTIVFVLSAATAFATGSSWGVMGILMPLVVPVAWAVMVANGMASDPAHYHVLYGSVAAVLSGAVWGDHSSPISDTTILSSMASQCDHIDHVRTQLPYALVVAAAAILLGLLPIGFGVPWYVGLFAGILALFLVVRFVGKHAEADETG